MSERWLALVIGNTRLHWGLFDHNQLISDWHTPHCTQAIAHQLKQDGFQGAAWDTLSQTTSHDRLPKQALSISQLWIASAVSAQTALWASATRPINLSEPLHTEGNATQTAQNLDGANVVSRSHIPLLGLYPTLGIDRAINLLGAGETFGWPILVIDSGTALTFTAGIQPKEDLAKTGTVYGGAILPGIGLQSQALGQGTAALAQALNAIQALLNTTHSPHGLAQPNSVASSLPVRWAQSTPEAIASGLIYASLSTINDYLTDWWIRFPKGRAVITGGDGPLLHTFLQQRTPEIASKVHVDHQLMFWGMRAYRHAYLSV
ncbi:MAG: type III pantothenate kinase [Cyanobacteria bacterium P01_A01_bin.116]